MSSDNIFEGANEASSDEANSAERKLGYGAAVVETLAQIMRPGEAVFVAGEDVGAHGGVFGYFRGLQPEFGEDRVVDTPIAEQAIIGLGIGSAVQGLRPVVDLMFMDFICVAMDQIVNQAAKLKYMFGGGAKLPLTITTAGGAGLSAAAQHSQSLEAMLCHVPGLKVVMPSDAYEVKGLLTSCVREDNPTVFIINKRKLADTCHVPEELFEIPLGEGHIVREGSDVTVVAIGRMVDEAKVAAEKLSNEGIDCELINPRTVQPLDIDLMVESVSKTGHLVIVHEAVRFGGIGAEIAAQIQEQAFDYLDAPIERVAAPFSPIPFSPVLEKQYIPDAERIVAGIKNLF
ncbi:MAG: alpha-ketoacid dehydrogenase subunit beta [Acidimicrobiales bacterium]|nr:alpha-ketoacid dehydrogenase subunit beta [Acidimicrobiales bacterium]